METYRQTHFLGELRIQFEDTSPFDPCSDTSSVHIGENDSLEIEVKFSNQLELFTNEEADYLSLPNDRLSSDFVTGEEEYWGEFSPKDN